MFKDIRSRILNDLATDNSWAVRIPDPDVRSRAAIIREKARDLALAINSVCPDSREKSVSLTELETSILWAESSLLKNETLPKLKNNAEEKNGI